jgi:hypothetical protein
MLCVMLSFFRYLAVVNTLAYFDLTNILNNVDPTQDSPPSRLYTIFGRHDSQYNDTQHYTLLLCYIFNVMLSVIRFNTLLSVIRFNTLLSVIMLNDECCNAKCYISESH